MDKFSTDIINWTKLKVRLQLLPERERYFHERDIWWMSLGVNLGCEQNGKNERFERPVVIIRKFSSNVCWVVPLSSKIRDQKFGYRFCYGEKQQTVLLSQLRLVSRKRLIRKVGKLEKKEFTEIKVRLKELL